MKKNEMRRECSTDGEREKVPTGFGGETWGKETTWNTQE